MGVCPVARQVGARVVSSGCVCPVARGVGVVLSLVAWVCVSSLVAWMWCRVTCRVVMGLLGCMGVCQRSCTLLFACMCIVPVNERALVCVCWLAASMTAQRATDSLATCVCTTQKWVNTMTARVCSQYVRACRRRLAGWCPSPRSFWRGVHASVGGEHVDPPLYRPVVRLVPMCDTQHQPTRLHDSEQEKQTKRSNMSCRHWSNGSACRSSSGCACRVARRVRARVRVFLVGWVCMSCRSPSGCGVGSLVERLWIYCVACVLCVLCQ